MKAALASLCLLLLFCTCSHNPERESLFAKACLLMEEHPDSALQLLDLPPEAINEWPKKERARYALLLARATDKCKQSLLPCDSLLNIALDYYTDKEKEKAVALLYKGRLAIETAQEEEAISYLQNGLSIMQRFPGECKIKILLLCSLGDTYFNSGYYDESIKLYRDMYLCASNDLEKTTALNNISLYYCAIGKKDSTLMYQRQALAHAIATGDSLQIAVANHNLSLEFDNFDEIDSAFHYEHRALRILPKEENPANYHYNLGDLYVRTRLNRDSALHYLNLSLEDIPIESKSSCLKSLYNLEIESGNHKAAIPYLEMYTHIMDSLFYMEQSTEIEQLIHTYNTKIKVKEEQIKGNRTIFRTIVCFTFACFLIILIYQNLINKRKRIQLQYQQSLEKAHHKLSSLKTIIHGHQSMIAYLQQEHSNLEQEQVKRKEKIKEQEKNIAKLQEEKQQLRNWLFSQSSVYKKVIALSQQKVSDKKQMKALTTAEQDQLKKIVFDIYSDHAACLQQKYPRLTESDVLFLCLQESSLEPLSIAICFGYSDTHPLNQKKYRIKERMTE